MRVLLNILGGALIVSYPFVAWWGLSHWGTAPVAAFLAAIVVFRALVLRDRLSLAVALPAVALALWGWRADSDAALELYPVLVNLTGLALFAQSLRSGMPMAERFARMAHPDLPEEGVRWCRKVTQAWCVFFLLNGSIAFLTVLAGDRDLWTLYNGFVAYILIGLTALVEYLLRLRHQRRLARRAAAADSLSQRGHR